MKLLFLASILIAATSTAACSSGPEKIRPDPSDVAVLETESPQQLPRRGYIAAIELPNGEICEHVKDRAITTDDGERVSHRCGEPNEDGVQTVVLDGVRTNRAGQFVADTRKMKITRDGFEFTEKVTVTARIASIALDAGMVCESVGEGVNVSIGGQPLSYDCGGLTATVGLVGRVTNTGAALSIKIARMTQAGDAFEIDATDIVDVSPY